jgi:hypothetical protein
VCVVGDVLLVSFVRTGASHFVYVEQSNSPIQVYLVTFGSVERRRRRIRKYQRAKEGKRRTRRVCKKKKNLLAK